MAEVVSKTVDMSFDDAEEKLVSELEEVGFSEIWEMDYRSLFSSRLGIEDYPRLDVLGVCNPDIAHSIMEEDPVNAAFLPCKVIVRESDEGVEIGIVNPIFYANTMETSQEVMDSLTTAQKRLDQAFENV